MRKYNTIKEEKKEGAFMKSAAQSHPASSRSPAQASNPARVLPVPNASAQPGSALTQREKGEATRQRRWEKRMEEKRLAAIKEQERMEEQRKTDERFMKEAVRQAKKAAVAGDVPIGCVIVNQGQIIARGYNRRNADKNALAHAEIICIKKSCRKLGDWRLEGCTMYITLEPCPMCAGAIVQARIPRVVIGCMNPKAGCAGSVLNMLHAEGFNHQAETCIGILEEECSALMTDFFQKLRKDKRLDKTPSTRYT